MDQRSTEFADPGPDHYGDETVYDQDADDESAGRTPLVGDDALFIRMFALACATVMSIGRSATADEVVTRMKIFERTLEEVV